MNMLRAHNTKTATVINGFTKQAQLKERAKQEGVPLEQLMQEQGETSVVKKKKKTLVAKKKNQPDFELVLKDNEGQIQTEEINVDSQDVVQTPVVEADVAEESNKIEAEETLSMIKAALKGKKGKKGKKKKAAPKEVPNTLVRFFNDYGESPHL